MKIKNLLSHSSGIPNIIRYKDIPVTATDNEKITRLSKEKWSLKPEINLVTTKPIIGY